jgi:SPP1 family predicted phage head-tail adaptor
MLKLVPAGEMTDLVTVQRNVPTEDDLGRKQPDWRDLVTLWAKVEDLSGSEFWRARQAQASTTHRVTHWYYAGLTAKDRYKFGAKLIEIETVLNPDGRRIQQQVMCQEQGP